MNKILIKQNCACGKCDFKKIVKQKEIMVMQDLIVKEFNIPYQYHHIIYLAIKEGYNLAKKEKENE